MALGQVARLKMKGKYDKIREKARTKLVVLLSFCLLQKLGGTPPPLLLHNLLNLGSLLPFFLSLLVSLHIRALLK